MFVQDTTVNNAVNVSNYDNTKVQYIEGVGVINAEYNTIYVINTAGNYNISLPNGNYPGHQLNIILTSNPLNATSNITLLYNDSYGNPQEFIFGTVGDTFVFVASTLGWQIIQSIPMLAPSVSSVNFSSAFVDYNVVFQGNVTSQGTSQVYDKGVVYNYTGNPTFSDNYISDGTGLGLYTITFNTEYHPTIYAKAYAINAVGFTYGNELSTSPTICLAKGTLITLENGDGKCIEDITYDDDIKVWDFDNGCFNSAKPLWIKIPEEIKIYNLLTFSDGSILKTINQHRIFNKELGKFTYPMTDDTPIGTTTFNVKGEEVTLISKEVIKDYIEYYNVRTHYHINLFANGILTSCKFNNIYPIQNMKFVKVSRELRSKDEFKNLHEIYIDGFRLKEQEFLLEDITSYVNNLEKFRKN